MSNNSQWGQQIIEELIRLGICHFCIAPGSRSTPLVAAIARHPKAHSHIFIDERSAAFFALGLSKYTHTPAAMVTTSGTAITHAYPAIIEAEAQNIPLLLISADRPPELRDSGANQTIDQTKLFSNHVRFFFDLPCPTPHFPPTHLLSLIDHAVSRTHDGPVHLNCMFRKPLLPDANTAELWNDDGPYCNIQIESATTSWKAPRHKRALLIIGMLSDPIDQENALLIAQNAQCPVLCDASSGIRLHNISNSLRPIDSILAYDTLHSFLKPDLVIHLGGSFVSKNLPLWMESQKDCSFVQINPTLKRTHTNSGTQIIAKIPKSIGTVTHSIDSKTLQQAIENRITTLCHNRFSEPNIIRTCTRSLPEKASIFLSNSMPIRDFNRFSQTKHSWIRSGINRGASGIDGVLATAAGWTYASQNPAILVIGDVAAAHDIGSFLQIAQRSSSIPLLVCIINNGGGGIFSFLPISEEKDIFETHFATAHQTDFSPIMESMGITSTTITDIQTLHNNLLLFFKNPTFSILELHTNRQENKILHKKLEEAIHHTISQHVGETS